jgi:signal peptidase I
MAQWLGTRGVVWLARGLDVLLIALVATCLFAIVLGRLVPLTGRQTLVVAGGSMEPTIHLGSAVITEPVTTDALRVGDVVSLRSGAQRAIFTHRIIRIAERDGAIWIETRGDANDAPDPSITPATAVIGRVDTVIPYAGFIVALLSIPSGVVFVLALGLLLLMATWSLDDLKHDHGADPDLADPDLADLDADDLGPMPHPAS